MHYTVKNKTKYREITVLISCLKQSIAHGTFTAVLRPNAIRAAENYKKAYTSYITPTSPKCNHCRPPLITGLQPISIFLSSSLSDCNGIGGFGRLRPEGASPAVGSGVESGGGHHFAEQRSQYGQELTPELHSHKGIEDGVEAAVEVTHRRGYHHGFLQRCLHSTHIIAIGRMKRVHHEGNVVWRPAEEKHCHHSYDHPDSSLPLKALRATSQPTQDAGVAEDHDS